MPTGPCGPTSPSVRPATIARASRADSELAQIQNQLQMDQNVKSLQMMALYQHISTESKLKFSPNAALAIWVTTLSFRGLSKKETCLRGLEAVRPHGQNVYYGL